MFVRPALFAPWDQFARKGANRVLGRPDAYPFNTYAEYLGVFNRLWGQERPGQDVRDYVTRNGTQSEVESEPRFQRRVLDLYLMQCGGFEL